MKTITNPHAALLRAVQALICPADREKPIMIVEEMVSTDWASATFVGEQHRFALRLEGQAAAVTASMAAIVAGIGEAEIPLQGQFVAEAAAAPGPAFHSGALMVQPFTLTALTIVD